MIQDISLHVSYPDFPSNMLLTCHADMTLLGQKWDAAEGLLYVCRKLLSQPYVAPVYAMLLYEWLLANKDAGGAEQRQKHVNLLVAGTACVTYLPDSSCESLSGVMGSVSKCNCCGTWEQEGLFMIPMMAAKTLRVRPGARQLFWSDVHSSLVHFQPLYCFMANEVALSSDRRRLDTLPPQPRAKLLSVVAAFLPYYLPSAVAPLPHLPEHLKLLAATTVSFVIH